MKKAELIQRTSAFVVALLVSSAIASLLSTQFVLAALRGIDIAVPLGDNLRMTIADLGVLKTLLPLGGTALLIAFLIAGLCTRLGGNRVAWFVVAGFSAMITLLLIIQAVLGVMPLAGARSTAGLVFQGLAGGVGGYLFARLTRAGSSAGDTHA